MAELEGPLGGGLAFPDAAGSEARRYVLPLAEAWIPGESILGLLVRNASTHGFANPARLLKRIGLWRSSLSSLGVRSFDAETAQAFAELLALDPGAFHLMHHGSPEPMMARLFGHAVRHDLISLRRRRVCPLCLRDSPHHRAIWDLSLLTVCPEHGVLLVDRCPAPQCQRPLTWSTPSVMTCSGQACRAPLMDAPVQPVETGSMDGIRGLVAMIVGEEVKGAPEMPVGDAIRLSFHLGLIAQGRQVMARPIEFAAKYPSQVHEVLDAGWTALSMWPHGFRAFLAALRARARGRQGRYGLRKEFGRLPFWLSCMSGEPSVRPLAEQFATYVAEQADFVTRWPQIRRWRSANSMRDRFVTGRDAIKLLGLNHSRFRTLADRHDLWLVRPTGKGGPSLLRADRFKEFANGVSGSLTKSGVARLLNTSKRAFYSIEQAGLLPVVLPDERLLVERPYRREDVQAFLKLLEEKAVTTGPARDRRGLVTADALSRGGMTIAEILKAVLAGKLTPRGINRRARGVSRLLFRPVWVHRALAAVGRTMSVNDAALALGVKQEVAYAWVRRSLIATSSGTTKQESGRRITPGALDTFRAEYVTGTEVARRHGLRARWVSVHLAQLGIRPVSGPETDGCRQLLFRRAEVEPVDPAKLVSGLSKLKPTVAARKRLSKATAQVSLWRKLGHAVRRELGGELTARYATHTDARRGLVAQLLVAGNTGLLGTYRFVLTERHARQLSAARSGWVAFGFADRSDCLITPWEQVQVTLPTARRSGQINRPGWQIVIRTSQGGGLKPFGNTIRPLASGKPGPS